MGKLIHICIFLLCILYPYRGLAALVSYTPQVINYAMTDYHAGNQNWSTAQGANGWMYFGNNQGLLQFDGIHWKLYRLPGNTAVRSLYIAEDSRIYVGSFEEFGYFESDDRNLLTYHSLKEKVTDYTFFNEEIWTINAYQGSIYFQSFSSFFIYDGKEVRQGIAEFNPLFFFFLDGQLYAQFMGAGFYKKEGDSFRELIPRQKLGNNDVIGILPYNDKLLLVTDQSGLYLYDGTHVTPWNIPAADILKADIANRVAITQDSVFIIGTISNGVLAIDKKGDLLWHLNLNNQLINNTVLGLHIDRQNNVWAALDNGIANIRTHSPIYIYEPKESRIGMVYDMLIKGDIMYLATNQGVYIQTEKNPYPQLIPNTNEQTWYIANEDNQVIAGHNRGTLWIENGKAEHIPGPNGGGTALRKCIIHGQEVLIQMSYYSMGVFVKNDKGLWTFSHNVEGFNNPVKSFEVDAAGTIWANHMYKGVYRVTLDETLHRATEAEYIGQLDSENKESTVNVLKLRGRIVLTDGKSFYTYEDLSQSIVPYVVLNEGLPGMGDTYRIVSLNNDRFWFIRNTEYALVNHDGGHFYPVIRIPFSTFSNPIIEDKGNIFVDKEGMSYFCLNGGIARFNPAMLKSPPEATLSFASVKAYNRSKSKSEDLSCISYAPTPVVVDYLHNNITFEFALPYYNNRPLQVYYKLTGYDREWLKAPDNQTVSYSNIPTGDYTMEVVLHDTTGTELSHLSYEFKITPPFYLSLPAILFYMLVLGALFVYCVKLYTTKEVAKKNRLMIQQRIQQEQQLKEQEQLIIKLKNEKLEDELTYKSKELASATLSIITQNDFLTALKKDIQAQQLAGNYSKKYVDKLIKQIDENLTKEDEWEVFQANFDRVHEHFFQKLKQRYPDLTPGDLRMCALLRLNMPTKEMAQMLSLSIRGVEAARYRLRKKLNLPEGESLVDFMITFE